MELYEKYGNDKDSTNINATIGAIGERADLPDEEEVVSPTHKSRPKQKPVVNPIESKQGKKSSVGKEKEKSSGRKKEIKHKYTCEKCGPDRWFKTKRELKNHCAANHSEE